MTDILVAFGLLALLTGFGVFVMWDIDRLIDRVESEANTIRELPDDFAARAVLEDARPVPYRGRYERDETRPADCGCRKHNMKHGCVRHDLQLRRAASGLWMDDEEPAVA